MVRPINNMQENKISRLVRRASEASGKAKISFIENCFKENPVRLFTALGIAPAEQGTFRCNKCESGTGRKGTGMFSHITREGNLRYHCFACGNSFRPINGTREIHPGMTFMDAVNYLVKLYLPEVDPVNDRELPTVRKSLRYGLPQTLTYDDRLTATYAESVSYRLECPSWQQKMADALGLPFEALSRPDIGKSFIGNDGRNPDSGDLVTYNLVNGLPLSLKVRHLPGMGTRDHVATLDYTSNTFRLSGNPGDARTFRMAGSSGEVCFGHDTVTDATSIVVIAEGQSDVLAICSAAAICGRSDITAIGRDSASHVLKAVDLDVLAGKTIIYCEDADLAGRSRTQENIDLLISRGCKVSIWSPNPSHGKDARDIYLNLSPQTLLSSIINA